jgi:hypothetical protein
VRISRRIKLAIEGKNLRHVALLKKLRTMIQNVEHVSPCAGVLSYAFDENKPVCLFATAFRKGVVSKKVARDMQSATGFQKAVGCTKAEAFVVIYGAEDEATHETGADYANAITALLVKYAYE